MQQNDGVKMKLIEARCEIYAGDSIRVVPFLHRQRLDAGFVPLMAFGLPHWELTSGCGILAQCVTDLRILCLARTAWMINNSDSDVSEIDIDDDKLRELALAGKDLLGNDWPMPKLAELPIEELFRRIDNGETHFHVEDG